VIFVFIVISFPEKQRPQTVRLSLPFEEKSNVSIINSIILHQLDDLFIAKIRLQFSTEIKLD